VWAACGCVPGRVVCRNNIMDYGDEPSGQGGGCGRRGGRTGRKLPLPGGPAHLLESKHRTTERGPHRSRMRCLPMATRLVPVLEREEAQWEAMPVWQ